MRPLRKLWTALLVVFLCLLCIGITTTVTIVRREGTEGLFKRKRDAVNRVMPEAAPLVDRIEEQVPKTK